MNKRGHVVNAILLSVGLGFVLEPAADRATAVKIVEVAVPVTLGALLPDIDTAFGRHRKTFHNALVLGVVVAYPLYFGNLEWVWLGVLTHYVLDVLGTTRGIALFYPLSDREFGLPVGVGTDSGLAGPVTVAVTLVEVAGIVVLVHHAPVSLPALTALLPATLGLP